MQNHLFKFFLLIVLIGCSLSVMAQQRPGKNQLPQNMDPAELEAQIGTVKVDDLPDAQIRMLIQRMEENGITEQQLFTGLQARGMSSVEIQKLRARIAKIRSTPSRSATSPTDQLRSREKSRMTEDDLYDLMSEDFEEIKEKEVSERQKKVFGYSLFNSERLDFEPSLNVATPKDYTIGPGDELIIDVWGASEQTYLVDVSPDGFIKIPNLGPIYVNALSMDQATERIIGNLTRIYSGLSTSGGRKANTFAQVSLGQVRTIKVSVVGEVNRPGTYDISSLASAFNALYLSGGPNMNGSFREIEVIRGNKIHTVLDVYDFLVNGVQENNIRLSDQDIIRVKPFIRRVEIEGEVKREGIYEAKEGDTFEDMIRYAGDLTENAYQSRIKVRRNTGGQRRFMDLSVDQWASHEPANGDLIVVEGITDRFENRVQLRGAVYREGTFELNDLTLLGLIEKADGLRGDAYMERGTIFRTHVDLRTEAIPFSVREIMKGEAADIKLQREDLVSIPSIFELHEEYFVEIFGEIRKPRAYPFHQNMRIEDLIVRAGGLLESASGARVEVARRVRITGEQPVSQMAEVFTFTIDKNLKPNSSGDFTLMPFDQVFIRRSPGYQEQENVKVEGEALFPGKYTMTRKNERISDVVNRAGGLTPEGYAKGATLIRRTEFYPTESAQLQALENLMLIREDLEEQIRDLEGSRMTESELLLYRRLDIVNNKIEKLREEEKVESQGEAIKHRKEQLEALSSRDTLLSVDALIEKEYENIGIDMDRILSSPGSKHDLILQDGDIIYIPRKLETVRMRGEFLYPVTVRYDQNLSFRQYLNRAGGVTDNGRRRKAYILYANGSVDRSRGFLFITYNPKVEPGAEIIVPAKPIRERLSPQAWVGLSTSIATLALIINNLANR